MSVQYDISVSRPIKYLGKLQIKLAKNDQVRSTKTIKFVSTRGYLGVIEASAPPSFHDDQRVGWDTVMTRFPCLDLHTPHHKYNASKIELLVSEIFRYDGA